MQQSPKGKETTAHPNANLRGQVYETKHLPLPELLDELLKHGRQKTLMPVNPAPHVTSLHLLCNVLLRAANVICPHMYAPVDRSPPSWVRGWVILIFSS